jgi:hypothetical protein
VTIYLWLDNNEYVKISGEHFITKSSSKFVLLANYYYGDKIKEAEVSQACSTHGERKDVLIKFWWENLKEREH